MSPVTKGLSEPPRLGGGLCRKNEEGDFDAQGSGRPGGAPWCCCCRRISELSGLWSKPRNTYRFEREFQVCDPITSFCLADFNLQPSNCPAWVHSFSYTGLFLDTFFWQINSTGVGGFWVFLRFCLSFLQNLAWVFHNLAWVYQNFVLFLLNPENKEFFNVIKLVMYRIY